MNLIFFKIKHVLNPYNLSIENSRELRNCKKNYFKFFILFYFRGFMGTFDFMYNAFSVKFIY